jgi:ABC-2 type transport system permease protein
MSTRSAAIQWLRRLAVMSNKEILQFIRDPVLMIILFYAFVLGVRNAGTSVSMQIERAPIAFLDHDRSRASRELIASFQAPWFAPYNTRQPARKRLLGSAAS